MKTEELENGQLAYRDTEGDLMILPMDEDDVRNAFIRRLTLEHFGDRDIDELLEKFKQAAKDAKSGDNIDKDGDLKKND